MVIPPGSGKTAKAVDLPKVAQSVGKTSRDTCGACHFFGGGGDGVKHGDLDSSMAAPDKALDVHMDASGLDFTCATCHRASSHDVSGSRYTPTAKDGKGALVRGREGDDQRNAATCVSCHDQTPHKKDARLDLHALRGDRLERRALRGLSSPLQESRGDGSQAAHGAAPGRQAGRHAGPGPGRGA